MRALADVWRQATVRYPYLLELPPFKSKWLYEAYEDMFARVGHIRTLLELGMYQGGSIALWRQALGCRVIGLDLSAPPRTAQLLDRFIRESHSENEVYCFWRTNQTDAEALREIVAQRVAGTLDVVIDDASHLYVPTRQSFEILFPLLRPGGVYVIEDWTAGERPDFQSPEGPLARVVHEFVDGLGTAAWPFASIEVRAACVMIFKSSAGLPVLRELSPDRARSGEPFNAQPNGESAIAILCKDASPDCVIVFGTTPLATTFGSDSLLTASVPAQLLSRPGQYNVVIRRNGVDSNPLHFIVEAERRN
jgi:predicted O-methyltransferase YrrM